MKANPRLRSSPRSLRPLPLLAGAMLLASCVPQVAPPPAQPRPAPSPHPTPTPAPRPAANWRDAPITPGDWRWSTTSLGSTASFSGGQFVLRCDRQQRTVTLVRAGAASAPVTMTITSENGARALTATPVAGGMAVAVPARDPLLDSMAFSRGRFAVQAAGQPPLYIPSWTEISRVVEDCR